MSYNQDTINKLRKHFATIRDVGLWAEQMVALEDDIKQAQVFVQEMIDNGTMEIHGKLFMDILNAAMAMSVAHKEIMGIGAMMAGASVVEGNDTVN